jgi:heat shock protein HslJ
MRISAALICLTLVACAAPGASLAPGASDGNGSSLAPAPTAVDGSWQLTSGRGPSGSVPIVDDRPITITIDGDDFGGTAACNQYGGRFVRLEGGRVQVAELFMTDMGCEPDVSASESSYVGALNAASAVTRDAEELVIDGPGVELRFAPLPPPPTSELIDTVWVLETLIQGDTASSVVGDRATLVLHRDGTFSGSTGCRSFEGSWVEQGERIIDRSMAMDGSECPPALVDQDSIVVSVIGDGFVPTIDGDRLTLTDPGGAGLAFRAEE